MSTLAKAFSLGKAALGRATPALLGGAAILQGAEIAAPIAKATFSDPLKEEAEQILREMATQEALQMKTQRLNQDMAANTARLAAGDPAIYNEIMAGRRLATGSRVFGGQPRTDLMEEVVSRMARGAL